MSEERPMEVFKDALVEALNRRFDAIDKVDVRTNAQALKRLRRQAKAGLELYRAIQGGYERCPLCDLPGLTHRLGCPITEYMQALDMPTARRVAKS